MLVATVNSHRRPLHVRLKADATAFVLAAVLLAACPVAAQIGPQAAGATAPPAAVLWYTPPGRQVGERAPVGNGRLGAMVFGKTDEEQIQLNEDTYWSGGPYSTTVKGGYRHCPRSGS